MRRAVPALALLAVTGWLLWPSPEPPPMQREPPPARPAPRVTHIAGAAEALPEAPSAKVGFTAAVDAVASGCGLDLEPVCAGSTCVALLAAPDLESPVGWARMAFQHPTFVMNVVGRDLGMGRMPCGAALDGLDAEVRAVEPPGADELWCAGRGPDVPTACTLAARRAGLPHTFDAGSRTLRF
ncbi:MAG: hypothetical protein H6736_10440 [Alphaproteobacteria bacterium]|nr:hypothetical protein [Alphaproteobacteria bacterium]